MQLGAGLRPSQPTPLPSLVPVPKAEAASHPAQVSQTLMSPPLHSVKAVNENNAALQ